MPRGKIVTAYPLSPMQQGMLFHGLGSDPGVHLDQAVLTLPERVDEDALVDAWQLVCKRHDALRTRFRWKDSDDATQEVLADAPLPVTRLDWRALGENERATRLDDFLSEDRRRGVVLSEAPLMRLAIMRVHDECSIMVWTHHHSIIDGRSKLRVLSEVFDLYDGRAAAAVEVHQLREHVEAIARRDRNAARAFFRAELAGLELPTPLPVAAPRASELRPAGHGEVELRLDGALTHALESLARDTGVTLSSVVQSALAILLSRYSGERSVVFGATRAGRHSVAGGDTIVGLMINTVPMRADVSDDRTLREHLTELRNRWVAMRPFEQTPLTEVREAIDHRSARPLFETILVFDALDLEDALRAQSVRWSKRRLRQIAHTEAPFTFVVSGGSSMILRFEHDRARLDGAAARRVLAHLETLLRAMAIGPGQLVGELPILPADERALLLERWAGTARPLPPVTLHGLVHATAEKQPERPALEAFGSVLTYRDLVRASRALAVELDRAGVGHGMRVCTLLGRGPELAVAWLAVLERGAAFVPVDPEHPRAHLEYVLSDSGATVVLTTREHAMRVPRVARPLLVSLADLSNGVGAGVAVGSHARDVSPDDDAYVIYTSGSTGLPKGVAVTHRAVVNHALAIADAYGLGSADRTVQFASPAFDVALEEVFPAWAAGACVLTRPDDVLSSDRFARWIEAAGATVLNLPTAYWHEWAHGLSAAGDRVPPRVRLVVIGGERASPATFARFRTLAGPTARLLNAYGPTETTITATLFDAARDVDPDSAADVPIGRPIANVRAYVLDSHLRPVPIGVAGELYLGGAGVARGYVGDSSAELAGDYPFVPDPFAGVPGARMYRTGDRARWRPEGELDFLGRDDDQLKIRGFRIEPASIERTLMEHPAVRDAAVLAMPDSSGELRLIAYVARDTSRPVSAAELRARLRDRWPAPMVPSEIVLMDALPRNRNDKIDRAALRQPERVPARPMPHADAPTSPVEELLAKIWASALGRERVGIHDDFFDLGGHSLLTLKIIDRAARAGLRITTEQLLRHPSVAALAAVVEMRWADESEGTVVVMRDEGERPPLFLVHSTPGDLLGYVNFVHALGPSQPVYGLQSLGLRRPEAAHRSIDSMAAHYVACVRRAQPTGPYYLAGWCYGGIVALEMARLLVAAGERVGLVALMEAWAPKPGLAVPRYYGDRARAVASLGPAGLLGLVRHKAAELWVHRGRTLRDHLVYEVTTGVLANRAQVLELNIQAIEAYRSRYYDGHVTLFRASEGVLVPDRFMGWSSLCRSVEAYDVRGRHETIMHAPQVKVLASLLRSAMDRGIAAAATGVPAETLDD